MQEGVVSPVGALPRRQKCLCSGAKENKDYNNNNNITAYKCARKLAPSLLTNRLALNYRESSHTRQIPFQTFKLPQVMSKLGLLSFSFTAADRFNCLPAAIRCADSLPIFIAATKNFIGFPGREG